MNPFQTIGSRRPESSQFDLSHTRKFSFKPGILYPILCAEAIPSDVFNYDANAVVRMAPMLSPIMHMVDVCVHSFFYPERLTQERGKFEIFITGGKNGDGKDANGVTIEAPYFKVHKSAGGGTSTALSLDVQSLMPVGSLADFLGLQFALGTAVGTDGGKINARPFIAFWRIYCEYFRDQNVDPDYVDLWPSIFDSPGGDITDHIYDALTAPAAFPFFTLPKVCWEKDYFTSALPFAQRGEAVEAPLTGTATVTYKNDGGSFFNSDLSPIVTGGPMDIIPTTGDGAFGRTAAEPTKAIYVHNIESVNVGTGGFTITALRTAARLQEWLEKMATGGARYIEQIKAQFGVTSSDARLQRAEYLGGGKIPMHISEVVQSSADDGTPLAEMAGHGVTAGQVTNFKKFVEEHGFFMCFIYLRPKTAYQQGIPRMFWNRFDKLDYAWPSFARIGEQEVLLKEIMYRLDPTTDDDVFGYQQRYAEYKYIPSTVHGEFQTVLNHWHWGRIFVSNPTLSSDFVQCNPDDRIFNVLGLGTDSLYCIVNNRITARRPLPYYGEPHL